jgi:hypothetical protein
MAALVGGGLRAKPGEISLAHNGVLFLDELPEFDGRVLDSLRQPLETGEVAISRANHRVTYPARFMLVAAMNPCRCGRAGEPGYACKRGPVGRCAADYQARLSGPLLDRIDLHIEVGAVTAADLILPPPAEGSREVAARVARARDAQSERYAALGLGVRTNAAANGSVLEAVAKPDSGGLALLRDAAEAMRLSAPRLSPGVAGGAYAGRPRRRGSGAPRAPRRSARLSRAGRRGPPRGVTPAARTAASPRWPLLGGLAAESEALPAAPSVNSASGCLCFEQAKSSYPIAQRGDRHVDGELHHIREDEGQAYRQRLDRP